MLLQHNPQQISAAKNGNKNMINKLIERKASLIHTTSNENLKKAAQLTLKSKNPELIETLLKEIRTNCFDGDSAIKRIQDLEKELKIPTNCLLDCQGNLKKLINKLYEYEKIISKPQQ